MGGMINTLGFDKPENATRVVVAMSGGVDSSVTAALLAEQGYEVVGMTLQLYDHGAAVERKGACCAGQDIYDARRVAETVGFPHYVLHYESRFRQSVIDDFADSYLKGATPIPCVRCNQTVKFRDLLETAQDIDADCLATGHYIQRVDGPHGPELRAAVDASKDQSYFLFATTAEQLAYLRFPLGGLNKHQTRALADRLDLPVAAKPDSQDICFVPNGDYASVIRKLRPEAMTPGDIVHIDGTVMGRHNGIVHYTVGQRRGLGIGGRKGWDSGDGAGGENDRLYVVGIDAAANRVLVGPRAALARDRVFLSEVNWLAPDQPLPAPGAPGLPVRVKLRSAMAAVPARIWADRVGGAGRAVLELDQPHHGVAPGQAGVCYAADADGGPARVLGGGWISDAENTTLSLAA